MNKKDEIQNMLAALGMPNKGRSSLCLLTLLALAGVGKKTPWKNASNAWLRIHDLILFIKEHYGVAYAENSRETIRKQAIHPFREAAIIEDNGKATNSPDYRYRITSEVLEIIRRLDTPIWRKRCALFCANHRTLQEKYTDKRKGKEIPFQVNNTILHFSPGAHNELQRDVLEKFLPQFAPGSQCLYVGDSAKRELIFDKEKLQKLGVIVDDKGIGKHGKLPDIILYMPKKKWLFFIEAVTSVGPVSPERRHEFEKMTLDVSAGIVYVTAFPNTSTLARFLKHLAWDTEVWLADNPSHMLHLNGDRFIGPR